MKIKFKLQPTQGQKDAYRLLKDDSIKYIVLVWSRQSGKSVFAEIALIESLLKKNKFSAYVSPTYQLGRKVFKEITTLLEGTGIIKKANATTLTIESIFKTTLQFFSVEAYTAIRGFTVSDILILDESAYYPDMLPNGEQIWGNVIMPLTKARCKKVIFISTPCGKRGIFYEFYLKAKAKEENIGLLERNIYDDSLVDEKGIEEIRKSIPRLAFEQEFECKFLDNALSFFTGFENCFVTDFKYSEGENEWIGVDLSSGGQDETIVTKINEDSEVKQYKITGTLDDKYRKIADIINNSPNLQQAALENNGLGSPMINEIKKLVKRKNKIVEWTTTNTSKEEIISALAVKIANKDIFFDKEDTELFSQFGTFICKYSKTKKMQFEGASGAHDDRIMSLAIANRCRDERFKYSHALGAVLRF